MQSNIEDIRVNRVPGASAPEAVSRGSQLVSLALRFLVLFGLWAVLSGMIDPFHLSLGAASSAFVTWVTADLFPPEFRVFHRLRTVVGMAGYLVWLMWKIAEANFAMLRLVFHPRMHDLISPQIVHFKTRLRTKLALTVLANSITLTPGTITVSIDERGYVAVHAIDQSSADGVPGKMEEKVGRVFGEF